MRLSRAWLNNLDFFVRNKHTWHPQILFLPLGPQWDPILIYDCESALLCLGSLNPDSNHGHEGDRKTFSDAYLQTLKRERMYVL